MTQPLPVTDDDKRAAWDVFFTAPGYEPLVPRPGYQIDNHTLEQLGKVIENDRKRVAEQLTTSTDA